jgi:hypothetical protein
MLNFDDDVAFDLAQKRNGDRPHRSEAEHRLYWSTFERMMMHQTAASRLNSNLWIRLRRFPAVLQRWWHERALSGMRVSKERSQIHPLIPKGRQG